MKNILSTCGGCGCGCGVLFYEEEGRIKGVAPIRNHPVNKGNLCIKGWNLYQTVNTTERLKKPLIKSNGLFKEVSWKEAINFVVTGFGKILKNQGGKGIGVIGSQKTTNEENYTLMKFARTILGTNNIDNCGGFYCVSLQNKPFDIFYSESIYDSIDSLQKDDVVFLIGANLMVENPQIGARILKAIRRGAKIFIISSNKIQLSLFAQNFVKIIPGSETAVINGILKLVAGKQQQEKELINSLELYTQEFIEKIAGVKFEKIEIIAENLKKQVKKLIFFSSGLVKIESFPNVVQSILKISRLTGSKVYSLGGQNNFRGAIEMGIQPDYLTDYQQVTDPDTRNKFETAWRRKIPSEPGLNVLEMREEALKFNLKGMYIVGENIVTSVPDTNRTKKALSNLEFLVVQDIYMNETTELANVILPASSFAEKDGTFTNIEGRIQRVRKVINPILESKTDLEIFNLLETSFGSKPTSDSPDDIVKEISLLSPHYKNVNFSELDKVFGIIIDFPINGKVCEIFPIEKEPVKVEESLDLEYPFHLITEKTTFCHHTATQSRYSNILKRELPRGEVELNTQDARELHVWTGQLVKVISRRGELVLPVRINDELLTGTVFIPLNFKQGNANILTGSKIDSKLKFAGWKSCAVKLEKL